MTIMHVHNVVSIKSWITITIISTAFVQVDMQYLANSFGRSHFFSVFHMSMATIIILYDK